MTGVVVIASKGQPMSVAYDPKYPICLFASEAAAVAVQVDKNGQPLTNRLDLDSKGEVIRIGKERSLDEGCCFGTNENSNSVTFRTHLPSGIEICLDEGSCFGRNDSNNYATLRLCLPSGIEIRSYSLVSCSESPVEDLIRRVVRIESSAPLCDATVDLVSKDLKDIPSLLQYISTSKLKFYN